MPASAPHRGKCDDDVRIPHMHAHDNTNSHLRQDQQPMKNTADHTQGNDRENGTENLSKKLKAFEVTLYQRDAMAKELEKERNSQIALNDVLCLEIEELRRALCMERNRSRAHSRRHSEKTNPQEPPIVASTIPGLEEDKSVVYYMFSNLFKTPKAWLVSAAGRMTLFSWWLGKWINEGLSIMKIENKWIELQQEKTRLGEEKSSLEEHAFYLQQLLQEREEAIQREQELNRVLAKQVEELKSKENNGKNEDFRELNNRLGSLLSNINVLSQAIDNLNHRMDGTSVDLESIYKKVKAIMGSQKRLESHERKLEEHLKEMFDVIAHVQIREEKRYFRDLCYKRSVRLHENRCANCHSSLGSTGVMRSSSFPNKVSLEIEAKNRVSKPFGKSKSDSVTLPVPSDRRDSDSIVSSSVSSATSEYTDISTDISSDQEGTSSSPVDDSLKAIQNSTGEPLVAEESDSLETHSSLLRDSIQHFIRQVKPRNRLTALVATFIGLCLFILFIWQIEEYKNKKDPNNGLYNKNSSFLISLFSVLANVGRYIFLN